MFDWHIKKSYELRHIRLMSNIITTAEVKMNGNHSRDSAGQKQTEHDLRGRMSRLRQEYSSLSLKLHSFSSDTLYLKEQYLVELKDLQTEIDEKRKHLKLVRQQRKQTDSADTRDESTKTKKTLQGELKEMAKKRRKLKARLKGVGKRGRKIKLLTVLDCYHSVMERRRKRREYYKRHRK